MLDGGAVDIKELAGRFSREELRELVRGGGKRVQGWHCQCPFDGCKDHGGAHRTTANIHRGNDGTRWVLSCHSCHTLGDYVHVYQAVHSIDLKTALERLSGHVAAPVKPQLHLVRAPVLQTSAEKLTHEQVRKVWAELAAEDGSGEAYLESRRLREAAALGYARFATEVSENGDVRSKAFKGYRVGALLSSLAGQPLGVQFRNVFESVDDKLRSLSKGHTKGVYFGRPASVLGARCVVVAEGIGDTLATLLWVKNQPDTAVLGVPGAGNIPALADAVDDAGIDVTGQLWVLLAQHDKGKRGNTSLAAFMQLKSKLQTRGADVVLENEPPGEEKDWALSWQLEQLGEWPPAQVRRYLGGDSAAGETSMSRAQGAAIWHSEEPLEPEHLGQDLTSLAYLLSADVTRVPICGAGEWRLNEMTDEVEYGGAAVAHDDYGQIRLNLEGFRAGMNNKRLRFADTDVRQVVRTLARKNRYSPVREYLGRLAHDGSDVISALGRALGLDEQGQGLELEFLRRWLISAVARAFEPGCQVDTMLVFQGHEGQFKSRFFEELGGKWFVRMSAELGSANAVETMRRGWIIELDEMDAVKRTKEFSTVKAFITRPMDTYVPKWIREAVDVRRANVFGGTVNDVEFLVDEDGDRRFWIVPLKGQLNRSWLHEHRDQVWGHAVALYRAKQPWHLEPELEQLRKQHNERFKKRHPWHGLIEQHLADEPFNDFVRIEDLFDKPLAIPPAQQSPAAEQDLGKILRRLGWERGLGGKHRARGWKRMRGSP